MKVPATQEAVVVRVEVAVFWMEVVRVSSTIRKFDLPSLSWPWSRPDSTKSSISLSISVSFWKATLMEEEVRRDVRLMYNWQQDVKIL